MVSRAERARRAKQAAAAKGSSAPARTDRTKAEVLHGASETFRTAELGLSDLLGADPNRRMPGLRNLVVFGHATTQAIQNLRSLEQTFDDWYAPIRADMRADPLMKFFWDLRSEILKEGTAGQIGDSLHIHHLDSHDLQPILSNPPPGARGFFIGDSLGGNGWEIELPDGTITKYYIALPDNITVDHAFHFQSPPAEHHGQALTDTSVEALARLYVDALREVVEKARAHFN
jgi:hypothetical protein